MQLIYNLPGYKYASGLAPSSLNFLVITQQMCAILLICWSFGVFVEYPCDGFANFDCVYSQVALVLFAAATASTIEIILFSDN